MTSFKEDEDLFKLIREMLEIDKKLGIDNPSPIQAVLPVDKRKQLEKQNEELYNKYITSKIEIDRIRIRETPNHEAIIDFLRKDLAYIITGQEGGQNHRIKRGH